MWCHEYCRQAADVVIKSAGVGRFLCKRACWNQNTELHMPTFWPCDDAALIISRWFINTSSVLLSFFDLETVRASYYKSPLGACSFMQHPCNAKQSGKSQTFMWQFSHTLYRLCSPIVSAFTCWPLFCAFFLWFVFSLLVLNKQQQQQGPKMWCISSFQVGMYHLFFPFLIY